MKRKIIFMLIIVMTVLSGCQAEIRVPSVEGLTQEEQIATVVLGEWLNAINTRDTKKLQKYYSEVKDFSASDLESYIDEILSEAQGYTLLSVEVTQSDNQTISGLATYSEKSQGGAVTTTIAIDYILVRDGTFYKYKEATAHDWGGQSELARDELARREQEAKDKFGAGNLSEWVARQTWQPKK